MSLGSTKLRHHHQKQSSLDSGRMSMDGNEDYTNMSAGGGGSSSHSTSNLHKSSHSDKTRSQPIAIQSSLLSQAPKSSSNSISPVYSGLHIGRKYSTGTPPKMYLPLSNSDSASYSSLPRQRTRKISRRDSKDSCSSSVTTPSSSSTIFPISLNSPSSPIKNVSKSPEVAAIKVPAAVMNVKYNRASFSGKVADRSPCSDYTMMDFDRTRPKQPVRMPTVESSDYVNYEPGTVCQVPATAVAVNINK